MSTEFQTNVYSWSPSQNYYDIRETTGFKNVSLAVSYPHLMPTLINLDFQWTSTEYSCCQGSEFVFFPLSIDGSHTWLFQLDEELTFIHPDDVELYNAWDSRAFELQVANHELLGHGSGKLFEEKADGTKNFDPTKVLFLNKLLWIPIKPNSTGD